MSYLAMSLARRFAFFETQLARFRSVLSKHNENIKKQNADILDQNASSNQNAALKQEMSDELAFNLEKLLLENVLERSGKPNLGGHDIQTNAKAGDDACLVLTVRVEDISKGLVPMPFNHPHFLAQYYENLALGNEDKYRTLATNLRCVSKLAKLRNVCVMQDVNKIIEGKIKSGFETKSGVPLRPFDLTSPELQLILAEGNEIILDCVHHGIRVDTYINVSALCDDVEQCTNDWNLDQKIGVQEATDNIKIITDLDEVDWVILVGRVNGPGRCQGAFAGGFVEDGETFQQAAEREGKEETGLMDIDFKIQHITCATEKTNIGPFSSNSWDPRAKFVAGTCNSAVVTHYTYSKC